MFRYYSEQRRPSVYPFATATANQAWHRAPTVQVQTLGRNSPLPLQQHMDLIRKHANVPIAPETQFYINKSRPDIKSALESLKTIVGISAEVACELLSLAPSIEIFEAWIERLFTWKCVERGDDIFMLNQVGFNVMREAYENRVLEYRNLFALQGVRVLYANSVHKYCKKGRISDTLVVWKRSVVSFFNLSSLT